MFRIVKSVIGDYYFILDDAGRFCGRSYKSYIDAVSKLEVLMGEVSPKTPSSGGCWPPLPPFCYTFFKSINKKIGIAFISNI